MFYKSTYWIFHEFWSDSDQNIATSKNRCHSKVISFEYMKICVVYIARVLYNENLRVDIRKRIKKSAKRATILCSTLSTELSLESRRRKSSNRNGGTKTSQSCQYSHKSAGMICMRTQWNKIQRKCAHKCHICYSNSFLNRNPNIFTFSTRRYC